MCFNNIVYSKDYAPVMHLSPVHTQVVEAAVRSTVVVLLLLIHCLMFLQLVCGGSVFGRASVQPVVVRGSYLLNQMVYFDQILHTYIC